MLRRTTFLRIGMNVFLDNKSMGGGAQRSKSWNELFFKPETRDERVKDYVPEVLEESLAEQRAVLAHKQTTRDLLVEHGQKVLKELENKAPTPTIYPALTKMLKLYGKEHLITQRALNYLLYPTANAAFQAQPNELVAAFGDNFRNYVESIEQGGSSVHEAAEQKKLLGRGGSDDDAPAAAAPVTEATDVTYYVKCVAAMSLANLQMGDKATALRCADAALEHVVDPTRKGGVLAMKAGILNQLGKPTEALEAAQLAIAASGNVQGYLQASASLKLLKRSDEAVALLEAGATQHPANVLLSASLETIQKALPLDGKTGGDEKLALAQ